MRRIPYPLLQTWKSIIHTTPSPFLLSLPKLELHVHLEGTLSPTLRFTLARRNHIPLTSARLNKTFTSVEELQEAYQLLEPPSVKGPGVSAFFEAYYGGMECLREERDFYELSMEYFARASGMGVRYCEVMFDPQAHTRRGIPIPVLMSGLRRAQLEAEEKLNVKVQFIMCILRDAPLSSALQHYESTALPYRHMIAGIGLDSNEFQHPPSLFAPLFARARRDGFKTTAHSDVAQPDAHVHLKQILTEPLQLDRVDHGLDAAVSLELIELIKGRGEGFGMTICPWAYVRHCTEEELFGGVRRLWDAGVRISVSSDSPAYVESNYVVENLALLKMKGGFSDEELVQCQRNAVEMCWASGEVKKELLKEIEKFWEGWKRDLGGSLML
ncbi:putative deaminase [Lachnellula occidentalis]|uniref:Putative deaminase n=1 Tax=Lachnellula occidentalis TaxID=215460 RepID=A0A8H8U647_9HELO|nr:putative deaminase [Lachnellula occidentalis]